VSTRTSATALHSNSAAVCVNAASGGGWQLEAALEPEGPPSGGGVDTYWLEGVLPLLS